ncbi:MAG: hypothetical protein LAO05_15465 [Acidobacteriia bacterium]|nr:hypothetical protein [Terriglobia bacterium]
MAFDVASRRGCLTAATLPFAAVARPIRAWVRRTARRERTVPRHLWWSRRNLDGVVRLGCEIEISLQQAPKVVEAVSALVAGAAAEIGLTVGSVGVVPGEEPLLVALAPRRDIVAPRVRDSLVGGETHRRKHLWLALPHGTYLASVVNPYRPFAAAEGEVAGIVRSGGASHALTSELAPSTTGIRIRLGVYSVRPGIRRLLSLARKGLDGAPDPPAAR